MIKNKRKYLWINRQTHSHFGVNATHKLFLYLFLLFSLVLFCFSVRKKIFFSVRESHREMKNEIKLEKSEFFYSYPHKRHTQTHTYSAFGKEETKTKETNSQFEMFLVPSSTFDSGKKVCTSTERKRIEKCRRSKRRKLNRNGENKLK